MIIRITVNDNDFHGLLKSFCESISTKYPLPIPNYPEEVDADEMFKYFQDEKKYMLCILNSDDISESDKNFVCDTIRTSFEIYTKNSSSREYLIDRLEVSIVDSINGKWENMEVFYIFTESTGTKVLCF